jgi:hypothetical protein
MERSKKSLTIAAPCVLVVFSTHRKAAALNATQPEPETREQCTERHLRQCRRMAELGMQLAEAAARKALRDHARSDPAAKPKDMAPIFARVAGTIQQAIKLETKLTAPSQPARRRPATPWITPESPVQRPVQRPVETYPEPPATEWPFLKQYAQPPQAETPPPEPKQAEPPAKAPAVTTVPNSKPAWLKPVAPPPAPPEPAKPVWTRPPPRPSATDPPRPTGPNWARLFER